MQIQKVLVPIDFSPPSRLALNHGIAFARKFRARLTLLHVVESSNAPTFPAETAKIEKEHHEQALRMLPALIAPEDQDDLDLHAFVKSGQVEDQILSTIREERIDIVVMGTHGRGLVGRWLIGSVTQSVLRNADIPILTVSGVSRFPAFDRILFATDFSEPSKEGSRLALELARMTDSNLIALHAIEVGVEGGAEAAVYLGKRRLEEARVKMDEFKAEASQQKIGVETVFIEGPAAGAILKTAEERSADFIVITLQKSDSMERTLLGSTAQRVIKEAQIPVLSIPAGGRVSIKQLGERPAA